MHSVNMGKSLLFYAVCVVLCIAVDPIVRADTVKIQNGDRLSGKVVGVIEDNLLVKTAYSESPVKVPFQKVHTIKTETPCRLQLANGDVITGRLSTVKGGRVLLDTIYHGELLHIPLTDIEELERSGTAQSRDAVSRDPKEQQSQMPERGDTAVPVSSRQDGKKETSQEEAEKNEDLWEGSLSVSGNKQSGNTDRTSAGLEINARRVTPWDRISLLLRYNYAEEDDTLTARDVYGEMGYQYNLSNRWYWILSSSLLSDEFRDLDLRTTAGLGVGYKWWQTEDFSLSTEAGLTYISRNYETNPDETNIAGRLSANLEVQLTDTLALFEELTLYPALEGSGHVLHNEFGVRSQITEAWHLKISHVTDYDSEPPAQLEDTDTTLTLGLGYSF